MSSRQARTDVPSTTAAVALVILLSASSHAAPPDQQAEAVDEQPVVQHRAEVDTEKTGKVPANEPAPAPDPPPAPDPAPAPPPAPSPPDEKEDRKIQPIYFYVGLGVTAAAGGVLAWSGVDAQRRHEEFEETLDPNVREVGMDAQLRTNILLGVTGGLGLTTLVLAAFTDWGSEEGAAALEIDAGPGGAALRWRAQF